MAGQDQRDDGVSSDPLFDGSRDYDFFAAVRALERRYPDRAPVGGDADPSAEVVRFVSDPEWVFPLRDVARVTPATADRPATMVVSWARMIGLDGACDDFVSERVRDADRAHKEGRAGAGGAALREFVDSFLHRPLSVLYATSEAHRPGAAYERRRAAPDWWKDDYYLSTGLAAAGAHLLPGDAPARFAGALLPLARYTGTVSGFEDAAAAHLGVAVTVDPLRGRWREGPGATDPDEYDARAGFTVRVGPMSWDEYQAFLPPNGPGLRDLLYLARLFAGARSFDVELLLRPDERPPVVPADAARLWLSAWPTGGGKDGGPLRGHIPAGACRELIRSFFQSEGT